MQRTYIIVRTLLALGIAAVFAAWSGSGPSATVTPPRSRQPITTGSLSDPGLKLPLALSARYQLC